MLTQQLYSVGHKMINICNTFLIFFNEYRMLLRQEKRTKEAKKEKNDWLGIWKGRCVGRNKETFILH